MTIQQMMNTWSIDDKFWDEGFDLTLSSTPTVSKRKDDPIRPFISSQDAWDNYSDNLVYEVDKAVREWIGVMRKSKSWMSSWKMRRYDYSKLWWCVFGTDPKTDPVAKGHQMKISRIFAYYCSTIKKGYTHATWAMTSCPKKMYIVSPARLKKPPYSLRLRIEWLAERGEPLTFSNMRPPKHDLDVGQSRYKKTQAAIDKRHAQHVQAYHEKWGEYNIEYQRRRREEKRNGDDGSGSDGISEKRES